MSQLEIVKRFRGGHSYWRRAEDSKIVIVDDEGYSPSCPVVDLEGQLEIFAGSFDRLLVSVPCITPDGAKVVSTEGVRAIPWFKEIGFNAIAMSLGDGKKMSIPLWETEIV